MENKMLECSKKRWAVITANYDKAKNIIEDIEKSCGKTKSKKILGNHKMITEFTDGTVLRWVPAKDFQKGFRCEKMWCDKNIDQEILNCVILPFYLGRYEDIIWV